MTEEEFDQLEVGDYVKQVNDTMKWLIINKYKNAEGTQCFTFLSKGLFPYNVTFASCVKIEKTTRYTLIDFL